MPDDPEFDPEASDVFAPPHIDLRLSPSDVVTVLGTKGLDAEVASRIRHAADMQTEAESREKQKATVERSLAHKYRPRGLQ